MGTWKRWLSSCCVPLWKHRRHHSDQHEMKLIKTISWDSSARKAAHYFIRQRKRGFLIISPWRDHAYGSTLHIDITLHTFVKVKMETWPERTDSNDFMKWCFHPVIFPNSATFTKHVQRGHHARQHLIWGQQRNSGNIHPYCGLKREKCRFVCVKADLQCSHPHADTLELLCLSWACQNNRDVEKTGMFTTSLWNQIQAARSAWTLWKQQIESF